MKHAPISDEGWQAWDLALRMQGQVRVGVGGIVGWDYSAFCSMCDAFGYDKKVLSILFEFCEVGYVKGVVARDKD